MAKRSREAGDSTVSKKRSRALKRHHQKAQHNVLSVGSNILKAVLFQQKEIEDEEAKMKANDDPFSTIAEDLDVSEDDDDVDNWKAFSASQIREYEEEVDEEEERILDSFLSKDQVGDQHSQCTTFADTLLTKIREKDNHVSSEVQPHPELDRSVIDLYKGVGRFLSKYTSGKVPKAFKRIPSLKHWEYVLNLTEPEKWSANAVFQATRIFISNLKAEEASRFCSLVLLPQVRDDIQKNKILHFSLLQALKKTTYKPKAFNKGILIPLSKSESFTLREAVIVGSVLRRVSIPAMDSGAALLKLAEMEYCGTRSYIIKILLDKKYCLPYRVLDGLVAHFMRFLDDTRVMPVIWHQSLLSFLQWYKNELTKEDKDNLERLIHVQRHYLVTAEIKRELNNSHNRGEKENCVSTDYPAFTFIEDKFDIPDIPMEDD